ncbi:hypothetical protein LSCM1_02239 [Leishmania martiniquensis]|uniref:Thioredoxin domain-containing protein n=1 Tax=Leishmania martiniquensis TaxID=1580590 RepID=A0A836KC52_9TRYP|nr:hypothetical protein LSCM1_02239 [Leishmania martiniquensis]
MRCSSASVVRLFAALFLISCLAPLSLAFPYGKSSAVTELTPKTLNAFVKTHKPVVILFYAPWCGHCKQFHPQFERFAESVKGTIRVGAIDADQHANIGQQFGVRGFPTIKYWKVGDKSVFSAQDYQGQRTAAALQSFMVGDISSSKVMKVSTAEQMKQAAREAPKKMLGVLLSAKDKVPPMFSVMSFSPKLKELPLAFAGSCSPQKGVAGFFGASQLPMLGVLRYTPADGDAPEKFEVIPYTKKAIAYDTVARFFADCAEKQCGSDSEAPVNSVNLDEDGQQPAQPKEEASRQSSVALPVEPVEYTPKVIAQFCSPQTRKIRGQSPLCVFSLSEHVHLDNIQKHFQNDPLLFFEATQHKKELTQQLKADFGVHLGSPEETTSSSGGSVVVLRHSKPTRVRYALLEHIDSDDDLQAALQRILNGEVHLMSERVDTA